MKGTEIVDLLRTINCLDTNDFKSIFGSNYEHYVRKRVNEDDLFFFLANLDTENVNRIFDYAREKNNQYYENANNQLDTLRGLYDLLVEERVRDTSDWINVLKVFELKKIRSQYSITFDTRTVDGHRFRFNIMELSFYDSTVYQCKVRHLDSNDWYNPLLDFEYLANISEVCDWIENYAL